MLGHEKMQPEEDANADLVRELQSTYRFRPEEEQMLTRVQERLSQSTFSLTEWKTAAATSSRSSAHIGSLEQRSPQPGRTKKIQRRFLNTLAAVFFVGVLIGTFFLTFNTLHQRASSNTLHQWTSSPFIPHAMVKNGYWFTEGIRLKMFTTQAGWALGDSQKDSFDRILHTTDGGHHWQDVTPTSYLSASKNVKGEFYVLDENTAWVPLIDPHASEQAGVLAGLLRTTDGGKTWQVMTIVTKQLDPNISFIDQNNGWQIVEPQIPFPGRPDQSAHGELYHTVDGGKTWQVVGNAPLGVFTGDIHFLSSQIGWLFGINGFRVTLDGGKTWATESLPLPPGTADNIQKVSFLNFTSDGAGYVQALVSGKGNYIYQTRNGGVSWQAVGGALPGDFSAAEMLDSQHAIDDSSFNQSALLIAILIDNRWIPHNFFLPKAPQGWFADVSVLSLLDGFTLLSTFPPAASNNDLYQTTDGGKTWISLGSLPIGQ